MSRSWKIRSLAAIAPCITAYFADRSGNGAKNFLMYSMNTTTTPSIATVEVRNPAAYAMATAIEIVPIASTSAYIDASARICGRYASRWPALMLLYSRCAVAARPSSCTTLMPDRCSCANAFMAASRTRICRNDSRMSRRAYSTRITSSGNVRKVMPVKRTSIASSTHTIANAFSRSATSVIAPWAKISFRDSMSFVMRVMSRPTGIVSKNAARCASTWSKIVVRNECIVRCPVSCTNQVSQKLEAPWPTTSSMYASASYGSISMCVGVASMWCVSAYQNSSGWPRSSRIVSGMKHAHASRSFACGRTNGHRRRSSARSIALPSIASSVGTARCWAGAFGAPG